MTTFSRVLVAGTVVALSAAVSVVPLNSTFSGEGVIRYKSLLLGFLDLPHPFRELNAFSVPLLLAASVALGIGIFVALRGMRHD